MQDTMTADVIVIGGGVAGLSCAMQLGMRGQRIVVVERRQVGGGSTCRAAGLLGQLRGTLAHTRMLMRGVEIVGDLEQQAGSTIYIRTGSVRIASSQERENEIRGLLPIAQEANLPVEEISIDDLARRLPFMKTDDLRYACTYPTDGYLEPNALVATYRTLAERHGVTIHEETPVVELLTDRNQVRGVRTPAGEFHAPVVVNAAGPWSYLVGELAEQELATTAIDHVRLVAVPSDGPAVDPLCLGIRDRQLGLYARGGEEGLIAGCYQSRTHVRNMRELPDNFEMSHMEPVREDGAVERLLDGVSQRFPWVLDCQSRTIVQGIMTFTPDGLPICGELPGVKGLYHCSGFCGHGIVQSPAIGEIMADLITKGTTDYDLPGIEADRFFDVPEFAEREAVEAACQHMAGAYYGQIERGRNDGESS